MTDKRRKKVWPVFAGAVFTRERCEVCGKVLTDWWSEGGFTVLCQACADRLAQERSRGADEDN